MLSFDPALLTLSTNAICPPLDITGVVNGDDSTIDGSIFSYDQATHQLTIDTQDVSDTGSYSMKLIASFTSTYVDVVGIHEFVVTLNDYCATSILTNPGQVPTTEPAAYRYSAYSNSAKFVMNPFTSSLAVC